MTILTVVFCKKDNERLQGAPFGKWVQGLDCALLLLDDRDTSDSLPVWAAPGSSNGKSDCHELYYRLHNSNEIAHSSKQQVVTELANTMGLSLPTPLPSFSHLNHDSVFEALAALALANNGDQEQAVARVVFQGAYADLLKQADHLAAFEFLFQLSTKDQNILLSAVKNDYVELTSKMTRMLRSHPSMIQYAKQKDGETYKRDELLKIAEVCLQHDAECA